MKSRWPEQTLATACLIKPPKSEARERLKASDKVSFAPMEDLGYEQKYLAASKEKPMSSVVGSYTYFAEGDVLLAKITPCFENGKLGIAKGLTNKVGFGSSEFIVFRPTKALTNEWLYYYLSRDDFRRVGAQRMGGAVGHQRVSKDFIENYTIPLPPIDEQNRIVRLLDETLTKVAVASENAKNSRDQSRALFRSYLNRTFSKPGRGWVTTNIGTHIRFIDYRGKTPKKTESGLRLITAKNVKMGFLQETPREFVSPNSYNGWMTRGIPRRGDVLFTTEAPLANVAQLDTDEKVVFAQRIIIMQTTPSTLDNTFLKYLLLSDPVQKRIHAKGTGATVKGIKASLLRTVEISFPKSVDEQRTIVAKLDKLNSETQRLESIYQQKIEALKVLKRSLLHSAFTGEL
jgi:type I restriction enzyme S subunit